MLQLSRCIYFCRFIGPPWTETKDEKGKKKIMKLIITMNCDIEMATNL